MKQSFTLYWRFDSTSKYQSELIQANNLPEIIRFISNLPHKFPQPFRIDGQTLKTNGRRRIEYFGHCGNITVNGYVTKTII